MVSLFTPATRLMNRLKYPAKFLLLGFFVLLTVGMLLGSWAFGVMETIDSSRQELAAIELLRSVLKQVQLTQQHRGLSAGVLGGNQDMKVKQTAKQAEVVAAVTSVHEMLGRQAIGPTLDQEWSGIRQDWDKLSSSVMSLSVADSNIAHGNLVERLLRFQTRIADAGRLTGDPDVDTFYLIDTIVIQLPEMLERLGKLRAKGTGILALKDATNQDRVEFSVHLVILQRALNKLTLNMDKVVKTTPVLSDRLMQFSKEMSSAVNEVTQMVNDDILTGTYGIPSRIYHGKTTDMINAGYAQLYETLIPALERQVTIRIETLRWHLLLNTTLAAVLCLLVAYFFVGMYGSIVAAVRQLSDGSRALAGGDLTVRISLDCHDELAQVAVSFNQMIVSFNSLLRKVQESSDSLVSAARGLSDASTRVSDSSQNQSSAASSMAAAVEQMTVSIDLIKENARSARDVSVHSGELSRESSRIVEGTVGEMQKIASTVNHSAEIIGELGRNTEEISAIVNVIKEIADQTNLLALNAAIEAARAGEQGRGFAVVADEVRKLAERTSNSTQDISKMIQSIQAVTDNAVASMRAGVDSVAEGVALSQEAGTAIGKVQEGAGKVVQVITDISDSMQEQAAASNDIANSVEQIAQMAESNNAAVSSLAATTHQLEGLANELIDEVRRFRLSS